MRIVSMVPSATEIVCALGLADHIIAISHDCDYPAEILDRPRLTATELGSELSSYEIDEKVRASAASGQSLYAINRELLQRLNPDLVLTQEQCSVCAVDRDRAVCTLEDANLHADWLSLAASDFEGLFQDVLKIGSATARRRQAESLVRRLASRLEGIAQQTAVTLRPRVFCLSWFDPLMTAGSWISEMVRLAGGEDRLGAGGVSSSKITTDRLLTELPQVIFLLPCSFSQSRTAREWVTIRDSDPWMDLPAVREGRAFALESSLFHRPGPRLVEGVELMASLLHPDRFSLPAQSELSRRVA